MVAERFLVRTKKGDSPFVSPSGPLMVLNGFASGQCAIPVFGAALISDRPASLHCAGQPIELIKSNGTEEKRSAEEVIRVLCGPGVVS
jgi:hypothetical protein